jgi:phage protein D
VNGVLDKAEKAQRTLARAQSDYLATSRSAEYCTTEGYLRAEATAWESLQGALLVVEIHEMGVTA